MNNVHYVNTGGHTPDGHGCFDNPEKGVILSEAVSDHFILPIKTAEAVCHEHNYPGKSH